MKCNKRHRTRLIRNYQRNGKLRNNKLHNVKNCATTHHAGAKGERIHHAGAKGERIKSSHSLLTLALDGGQLSASRPGRALSRKRNPEVHRIGGWVGLRTCLDTGTRQKILRPCLGSNPGRPVCTQTLHRLSYPISYPLFILLL
jgi:hypothetical protein